MFFLIFVDKKKFLMFFFFLLIFFENDTPVLGFAFPVWSIIVAMGFRFHLGAIFFFFLNITFFFGFATRLV